MCEHGDTVRLFLGQPVGVDRCIVPLVKALNSARLRTIASCCGHGYRPGVIALSDGRELLICKDYETARLADSVFPDIHGQKPKEYRDEKRE